MSRYFIITADRSGFRAYAAHHASEGDLLDQHGVLSADLTGQQYLTPEEQSETANKAVDRMVVGIERFLSLHPDAAWNLAAPGDLNRGLMNGLSTRTLQRLNESLDLDLGAVPPAELPRYFHELAVV